MKMLNNQQVKIEKNSKVNSLTYFVLLLSTLFLISITTTATAKTNEHIEGTQSLNSSELDMKIALDLLNQMNNAIRTKDYQIFFIQQNSDDVSLTYRYNHIYFKNQEFANLLALEGSPKEIILHDGIVSYFQSDNLSFSLSTSKIAEVFPDVVYNDFNLLTEFYDFISLGKGRIANKTCELIRIVPKNKDRYNYVLWIDKLTSLPLRIDLLDLNYKIIQQYKALSLNLKLEETEFINYIENRNYPTQVSIDKQKVGESKWRLTWLPAGFKEQAAYNINFDDTDIDTHFFSDGIFSFTVSVSDKSMDKTSHIFEQNIRTIYSTNKGNYNIVIIGTLPLQTIERIAKEIELIE